MKNIINKVRNNKRLKIVTTIIALIIILFGTKYLAELTGGLIASVFIVAFTKRLDILLFAILIYIPLYITILLSIIYLLYIHTKIEM